MSVCGLKKSEAGLDPTEAGVLTIDDMIQVGDVLVQAVEVEAHGLKFALHVGDAPSIRSRRVCIDFSTS